MSINFDWLDKLSIDFDEMRTYCSNDEETEFCWWIKGDLTGDKACYDEIVELIEKSLSTSNTSTWRGNVYWLTIMPTEVILKKPRDNVEFHFNSLIFLKYMNGWYQASMLSNAE